MIRSYLWKVVLGVMIGAGLALGASFIAPKKYEGFVQILIDQKQLSPAMAMSAPDQSIVDLTEFSRPRSLTTQVQQLTGYDVLREASEKITQDLNIPSDEQEELQPINMRENVFVDAELGSDVVSLRVRMSSPAKARAFAAAMYTEYERRNGVNARTLADRALGTIRESMAGLKAQMDALDQKMKQIRQESGITDPGSQFAADYASITRARETRDMAAIELATARGRLEILQQELKKIPPRIGASETTSMNGNILDLENKIATTKAERDRLLERYYPDHDLVKQADATIKAFEDGLKTMRQNLNSSSTSTVNPNYQAQQGAINESLAAVTAIERRYDEAAQKFDELSLVIDKYPEVTLAQNDIQRQVSSLERLFLQFNEQYRTLELSKLGRVTPTTVVTPATALPEPVSPKPLQNSVIGGLVGLLIAGLICARREATRMPIRSLAQLNALSSHVAYRTVPRLGVPFRGLGKAPHESYETMVLNCLRSDSRPYRVAVFGIVRDSGASTAALNYAQSVLRRGLKPLIVMADARSTIKRLGKQLPEPGQVSELTDGLRVLNAVEMNLVEAQGTELDIAAAVKSHEADVTVFDLDYTLRSADYAILSQVIDEAIVLVRADRVRSVDFATVQQALKDAGCKQVTVVLTFASSDATTLDRIEVIDESKALPQ
ncbi:MAG: hypothetical protein KF784_02985 [Fimbriimonadaceae bacterium]|nr:hypothetical protein [Fimbriimonadaceae bacterium]